MVLKVVRFFRVTSFLKVPGQSSNVFAVSMPSCTKETKFLKPFQVLRHSNNMRQEKAKMK